MRASSSLAAAGLAMVFLAGCSAPPDAPARIALAVVTHEFQPGPADGFYMMQEGERCARLYQEGDGWVFAPSATPASLPKGLVAETFRFEGLQEYGTLSGGQYRVTSLDGKDGLLLAAFNQTVSLARLTLEPDRISLDRESVWLAYQSDTAVPVTERVTVEWTGMAEVRMKGLNEPWCD